MRALSIVLLLSFSACSRPAPPPDAIRFEHGPHIARGAGCDDCHGEAGADGSAALAAAPSAGSTGWRAPAAEVGSTDPDPATVAHPHAAERPLLPSEATCRTCHDDPVRDRCAYCHTRPEAPGPYPMRVDDIHFDHGVHEQAGTGLCVRCHAGGGTTALAFDPRRPSMATCTDSCHADDMRELRCAPCHTDLHRYRLDDVALLDHGPGFLRRHGVSARADASLCTQCHDPTYCEDCHLSAPGPPLEVIEPRSVHRDFVHRGDFLSRHPIEANLERGTCVRCHGTPFCDDCHRESGVGGGVAPGSPHPPGWLDPTSSFGHARAARRDLLSCVSCHEGDAETTCVPCHRTGSVAGDPHPPGFGGGIDPLSTGVCRACHVDR